MKTVSTDEDILKQLVHDSLLVRSMRILDRLHRQNPNARWDELCDTAWHVAREELRSLIALLPEQSTDLQEIIADDRVRCNGPGLIS